MFSLLVENKIASTGVTLTTLGVILLIVASTVPSGVVEGDIDQVKETQNENKKTTLNALGASVLSLGVLLGLFDVYTRFFGEGASSSFDMSEMSSSDLESFQERVAAAAANLRRSMEESSASSSFSQSGESSAELAARASAQISSFIQNYS